MPRPLSQITERVRDVLKDRGTRPATWRDVAAELAQQGVINDQAPAEAELVRLTIKNMAKRGEVELAARLRRPGVCRPMSGWVRRTDANPKTDPGALLQMALQGWAS